MGVYVMDILSFRFLDGRGALVRAVFIFVFFALTIITTGQAKGAVPYSSEEQIYLKNITPTLYEFSQLANEVSTSAITLQSAPTAQCSGQFSYYRGLMNSFEKQLSAFSPPPRLQSVHIRAVEAITDYENGLKLYGQACVEEDFGVKEGLVERGAQYLNTSVEDMESVYAGIEKVTKSKPMNETTEMEEAPQEQGVLIETQSKPTVVLKETDTEPVAKATEDDANAIYQKPAREKTAEEIIKEIEMKVKAKNRSLSNETTVTSQTVYETPRVSTHKAAPEETARAVEVAAPKTETVQPEEKAIVVEQSNTEIIEPEPFAESSHDETQDQITVQEETRTETVQEPQSADDEKAKEVKIAALNEKIMENTTVGENQGDAARDIAVNTGTERAETPVESSVEELTPETTVQDVEEPVVIEEEQAEVNAGASEDEISQEERIERINKKINERIRQRGVSQNDSAGEETLVAKSESATVYSEEPADEVALSAPEEREKLSAPADSEIKSWCEARMGTGSELKNCIQIRSEAKQSMNRMVKQFPPGTEAGDIIEKCKADWKEGDAYNYEMVISCTQFFCKQKGIRGCDGAGQ
jgi:hypothetical protein